MTDHRGASNLPATQPEPSPQDWRVNQVLVQQAVRSRGLVDRFRTEINR